MGDGREARIFVCGSDGHVEVRAFGEHRTSGTRTARRPARPRQSGAIGAVRAVLGLAVLVAGWALLVAALGLLILVKSLQEPGHGSALSAHHLPGWLFHGWQSWLLALAFPFAWFLTGRLGRRLRIVGRQLLTRDVADLTASDRRPPVLYLRTFGTDAVAAASHDPFSSPAFSDPSSEIFAQDQQVVTGEEQLARALRPIGPVVAVGDPKERLPRLGAARMYVGDDWQQVVLDLMGRARLVVVGTGFNAGVLWELEKARETLPPERLVLVVTLDPDAYDSFRRVTADLFGAKPLPAWPDGRATVRTAFRGAVHFDEDWTPRLVPFGRGWAENRPLEVQFTHGLRVVYERCGTHWPGVTLHTPWQIRTTRRRLFTLVFNTAFAMTAIAALVGLLGVLFD
ncbi:hypothetical protein ACFZAR_01645 [Streptomyces sp. NPDC008222]|uniref:hypothetical protein n=1 Tax=Streptomyces sp. NPDC008222 TaxID=3364820 RepID=UPI0036EBAFF4